MEATDLRRSLIEVHTECFGWAVSCCRGDRELAQDVLQTVYLRVLDGSARFRGRSSFRTWLFGVIRNAARGELRSRWWSRVMAFDFGSLADESTVAADAGAEEETAAVRAALDRLSARQREVAHLVFYQSLTVDAAAAVLGISPGTARQHYGRAKRALRLRLQFLEQVVHDE